MKKILTALVIIAIIGAGAWYFLKPSLEKEMAIPAELLPADTLLMVEINDLEKRIEDFKSSKLGAKLKEIDLIDVMQKLKCPPEALKKWQKVKIEALTALDSMWFKEIFGQEAVLAVLPLKLNSLTLAEPKKILGSLVLISRPKHNVQLIKLASLIFAKKLQCQTETYAGYEIKTFEIEHGTTVSCSLTDGLLVAALDQQTIKNCLDLRKNRQTSLADNEYYQNLRSKLAYSGCKEFFYNNTENMYKNILDIFSNLMGKNKEFTEKEHLLSALKGFKAVGYASYDDGSDLLKDKTLLMIDKDGFEPLYARAYNFKPEENKTLPMVPADTLVYYWANNLDLKSYFDIYCKNQQLNDKEKEYSKDRLEREIGGSLDDLFSAFAEQFGIVLADVKTRALFPIPKLAVIVEVANREAAEKLIKTAMQRSKMILEQEEFHNVKITYMMLPFGKDLQPAYAFFNDFCLISISRGLIKDMIDACKKNSGITTDRDFHSVNKGLTGKNNNIIFIKVDHLIDKLKAVVSWGGNMMVFKSPNMAERGDILIKGVINPLLDGLTMYKTIGARTFTKKNEIAMDRYYKIER